MRYSSALIHLKLLHRRPLAMLWSSPSVCIVCLTVTLLSFATADDLTISKHTQIGCLTLKADKQFIAEHIQENHLLPFQTFSSPQMSIELCFLLCRRWLVLMHADRSRCICLYTLSKPYELHEYLGEYSSDVNCAAGAVEVHSLTKDVTSLPTLSSAPSDDWALDGCYELEGIQRTPANLRLTDSDFPTAIDLCREHCHASRRTNYYYSYFVSRKKSCYCLPIQLHQTSRTMALRRPLMHCSFLPSICQAFGSSCKQYYSDTNVDTLVKVDVHRYCLSTETNSFEFDRTLYACLSSIVLRRTTTVATISSDNRCVPMQIKTRAQWNALIYSSWITDANLFVPIEHNSTYAFKDLFPTNQLAGSANSLCVVMKRTVANAVLAELILCSQARTPGSVLCLQKPLQSAIPHDEEFRNTNIESRNATNATLSCPADFVLFNNVCYYTSSSTVYDAQAGERLCHAQHANSSLVKFDSHDWGNINITRFLGRLINDVLLELFYDILERRLLSTSDRDAQGKDQWRLLLGDRTYLGRCVLRQFSRSTGGFVMTTRCSSGGYPVCQSEPIRTIFVETPPSSESIVVPANASVELTTELVSTTPAPTPSLNSTNETGTPTCENCTNSLPIADEDLLDNETKSTHNTSIASMLQRSSTRHGRYRPLILILCGPLLGLLILLVATGLLIWRCQRFHGVYSTPNNPRGKRSSTVVTVSDAPSKPPRLTLPETDLLLTTATVVPFPADDDHIELLSTAKKRSLDDDALFSTAK